MQRTIDFAHIIKELGDAGIPPKSLAGEAEVAVTTIYALQDGRNEQPRWGLGDYLLRKHFETFQIQPTQVES